MEELLHTLANYMALIAEGAAVFVVTFGSLEALAKLLPVIVKPSVPHGVRKIIWRQFGVWLLLGLEFELAADIIKSVVSPTWEDIGELGAIAIIRTFLNFFLERDLEHAQESGESSRDEAVAGEPTPKAIPAH
jgi:uncharacterized membrane protein